MAKKVKQVTITIPADLHEDAVKWCDKHRTKFSTQITAYWHNKLKGDN